MADDKKAQAKPMDISDWNYHPLDTVSDRVDSHSLPTDKFVESHIGAGWLRTDKWMPGDIDLNLHTFYLIKDVRVTGKGDMTPLSSSDGECCYCWAGLRHSMGLCSEIGTVQRAIAQYMEDNSQYERQHQSTPTDPRPSGL